MHDQLINPATPEILMNQLKTVTPSFDSFKKPRSPKTAVQDTAMYGTPFDVTRPRIRGADPSCARPTRIRAPEYTFEFAADSTTVNNTALMMDGKVLTPARFAAMTNGELAASVVVPRRSSLSYGMSKPMKRIVRIKKMMIL